MFVSKKEHKKVLNKLVELQQSFYKMNIMLAGMDEESTRATGNPYQSQDKAIAELSRKYEGAAEWGCAQAKEVIDLRAVFTMGDGIQVSEIDPATGRSFVGEKGQFKKEVEFIERFITYNDLDEEGAQEFAKEAEIEGRILFKLHPNKEKKQVDLRFLSYNTYKYNVEVNPEDYKDYVAVKYKDSVGEKTIEKPRFVYKKFSGRVGKVNEIMPRVATILRNLEDADKALKDLRGINNLFASPTPVFECEDEAAADFLDKRISKTNWKIGKYIVLAKAALKFVSIDGTHAENLIKEFVTNAKIISGVTGIPVHFLGLPDLMSNRSTSTDLFELIIAATNKERRTWVGVYEELFTKALELSNKEFGTTFTPGTVTCNIPQITAEKLKELVDIWLPLYQANAINLDYLVGLIPNADIKAIKSSAEEAARLTLESIKLREQELDAQGTEDAE
ncbi:MAG TPA: hypothetical protein PLB05_05180 [Candidatus Omnitrophota bacterium]|nr:hypothetical protein [Candidatus Omnitrophota bacterium]HPN56693.1 hypothetical protein [Candidatus Omnitrophota bacterium]